jgi:sugar phosphate isomerase/epimerase
MASAEQLADAAQRSAPRSSIQKGMEVVRATNRRGGRAGLGLPGEGTLDLDRFASTLLDRGWDGTVSVEVLSADLRTLPADTLMRRLYHSAVPFWR